jgi:polyphosphate glucokinase
LGNGWVGFDYRAAFKRPVKIINDAAMQALGSYRRGRMLFLGLGTGLGSAMIVDGVLEPMELGHLPYKKATFEDYVGIRGLKKYGKARWQKFVADVVKRLIAALEPDDVVIGGGNVHKLKVLPPGCRAGDNENAFLGGFRLWHKANARKSFSGAMPDRIKRNEIKAVVRNKTKNHKYESHDQTTYPTPGLESPRRASQTNPKIASAKTVR